MELIYEPVGWKNGEAGGTPINEDNLNKIEQGISECVRKINELDNDTTGIVSQAEHYAGNAEVAASDAIGYANDANIYATNAVLARNDAREYAEEAKASAESAKKDFSDLSGEISHIKSDLDNLQTCLSEVVESFENINYVSSKLTGKITATVGSGIYYICDTAIDFFNKNYFAYAKIKVSNLTGYIKGTAYLKYHWEVNQSTLLEKYIGQSGQIFDNGEFELYGNFIGTTGRSKLCLLINNVDSEFSFDYEVEKLFLFETEKTSSDLLSIINNSDNSEFLCEKIPISPKEIQDYIIFSDDSIVDCWGDSITQGSGGTNYTYPKKLQELIGTKAVVNNYGHGGETAEAIAFRQGGLPAIVEPFTLSNSGFIPISFKSVNGASLSSVSYSGKMYGDEWVYVNGMKLMFRNKGSYHAVAVTSGSDVGKKVDRMMMMRAIGCGKNHTMVICIGQNGWVDSNPEHLADVISLMIEHNSGDKYIVCGRPTGNKTQMETEEMIIANRFGNHYVNLREYISAHGLDDNNLTPTSDDTTAMENGEIPPQIKSDGVHLNDYGYISMAMCIYQRGKDLGYWR